MALLHIIHTLFPSLYNLTVSLQGCALKVVILVLIFLAHAAR